MMGRLESWFRVVEELKPMIANGKELPTYPFRTDNWPLKPHYGEDLYYVVPPSKDPN